jgi:hypothetical protein
MSSPYDRNPQKTRAGYEKDERYEIRPSTEEAPAETAPAEAAAEASAASSPEAAAPPAPPAPRPASPDDLRMPVDLDRLLGGIGEEPTLPAVPSEAAAPTPASPVSAAATANDQKLATPDDLRMPVNLDALLGGIGEEAPAAAAPAAVESAPAPAVVAPAPVVAPQKLATPEDLRMPVDLDRLLGGIGEEK